VTGRIERSGLLGVHCASLGTRAGLASFEDVLLARAGRLDHLVNRAISPGQELVGEAEGNVVDDFGFWMERRVW
jgi:hypothetical protein